MEHLSDNALLEAYVQSRSEPAFAALVQRHLNLVFAQAVRLTAGASAEAEDIAQVVFCRLAENAARLRSHPCLAGWLYTAVSHEVANRRRSNQRRLVREREVSAMKILLSEDSAQSNWNQLAPVIDECLAQLRDSDRHVLLLRFFQDRTLKEVGAMVGLTENAAQMRIERALEKLKKILNQKGIASTSASLALGIGIASSFSAPSALAATITTSALGYSAVGSSAAATSLKILMTTKMKLAVLGLLAASAVTFSALQKFKSNQLIQENRMLASQVEDLKNAAARPKAVSLRSAPLRKNESGQASTTKDVKELATLPQDQDSGSADASALKGKGIPSAQPPTIGPLDMDFLVSQISQQMADRGKKLSQALNLTPEQSKAVQELLQEEVKRMEVKLRQKVGVEPISAEDQALLAKPTADEQIPGLLSEEQKNEFNQIKNEELDQQTRNMVNADLEPMKADLDLDSFQAEKIFNAFYQQQHDYLSGKESQKTLETEEEIEAYFKNQMEQRIAAVAPYLTPKQLEGYRQMELNRSRSITGPPGRPQILGWAPLTSTRKPQ